VHADEDERHALETRDAHDVVAGGGGGEGERVEGQADGGGGGGDGLEWILVAIDPLHRLREAGGRREVERPDRALRAPRPGVGEVHERGGDAGVGDAHEHGGDGLEREERRGGGGARGGVERGLLGHLRGGEDALEQRGRDPRRHERHDHHHREQLGGDDPEVQPDVEHHELHQAAGVHQHADRRRGAEVEPREPRGGRGAAELADARDGDDPERCPPRGGVVEQADLRAETAVREEQREEDDRDEVLDLLDEHGVEAAVARDDRSEEEGAEEGVDADPLGHRCGGEEHEEDEGDGVAADGEPAARPDAREHRTDDLPHHEHVDDGEAGRLERGAHARGAGDGHHEGEHAPRGHVVHGGGGEREGTHARADEAALREEAGEDRERRHAQGGAEEEAERDAGDAGGREGGVQGDGGDGPEDERDDDPGVADGD
jgi:hypothetical protein